MINNLNIDNIINLLSEKTNRNKLKVSVNFPRFLLANSLFTLILNQSNINKLNYPIKMNKNSPDFMKTRNSHIIYLRLICVYNMGLR